MGLSEVGKFVVVRNGDSRFVVGVSKTGYKYNNTYNGGYNPIAIYLIIN